MVTVFPGLEHSFITIIETIFSAQLDAQATQEEYLRTVGNSAWCLGECLVAISKVEKGWNKAQYVDRWTRLGLEYYPWSAKVVGGLAALAEFRFDNHPSRGIYGLNSLAVPTALPSTTPLGFLRPPYFRTHIHSDLPHFTFSPHQPLNALLHKTLPRVLASKPKRSRSQHSRLQNVF